MRLLSYDYRPFGPNILESELELEDCGPEQRTSERKRTERTEANGASGARDLLFFPLSTSNACAQPPCKVARSEAVVRSTSM